MTNVRSFAISATAAVLLVAGSACSDSSGDPPQASPSSTAPSTPSSTAPSTPSSTATPSESELASQRAEAVVRRYFAVLDELGQDPASGLRRLETVATSTELNAIRTLLRRQHDQGQRQVGDTQVAEMNVQSVNLDNSDPSAGRVPTVLVDVCWDVSRVDVVDKNGKSIVSPNRADTAWTRYTVANYHYAADPSDGWRVASGRDLKQTPCAAS